MSGFNDRTYFYLADIGRTEELSVTDAGVQTAERLLPGRYLVQVRVMSAEGSVVWMRPRAFSDDAVGAIEGAPSFPFNRLSGVMVVEFHVRKNYNDQLQFITPTGETATVSITKVSAV